MTKLIKSFPLIALILWLMGRRKEANIRRLKYEQVAREHPSLVRKSKPQSKPSDNVGVTPEYLKSYAPAPPLEDSGYIETPNKPPFEKKKRKLS